MNGVSSIEVPPSREDGATVRLVSMDVIRQKICPLYLKPVPSVCTLGRWFSAARLVKFKNNPGATRGGGRVYYRAVDVERWLRQRAGL